MKKALVIDDYGIEYSIAVAKLVFQQRRFKTVIQLSKEMEVSPNTIMNLIWRKPVTDKTAMKLLSWSKKQPIYNGEQLELI